MDCLGLLDLENLRKTCTQKLCKVVSVLFVAKVAYILVGD